MARASSGTIRALLLRLVCSSCFVVMSGALREEHRATLGAAMVCEKVASLVKKSSPDLPGEQTGAVAWSEQAQQAGADLVKALGDAPKGATFGQWKGSALQRAMYVGGHVRKLRAAGVAAYLTMDKGFPTKTFKVCFTSDLTDPPPKNAYRAAVEISLVSKLTYAPHWSRHLPKGVVGQDLNQGATIAADWDGAAEAEPTAMPVDLLALLEAKGGALDLYKELVAALKQTKKSVYVSQSDPGAAAAVAESFGTRFRDVGIALNFCHHEESWFDLFDLLPHMETLHYFWLEYADLAAADASYSADISQYLYRKQ